MCRRVRDLIRLPRKASEMSLILMNSCPRGLGDLAAAAAVVAEEEFEEIHLIRAAALVANSILLMECNNKST
jgi:hypothetical protein